VAVLVCISGSPRRGGNSDLVADRVKGKAEEKGWTAKKLVLNEMNIRPCQGCERCSSTGVCDADDDMAVVYKALKEADVVAVVSPVYFGTVSAQTKIMVDRIQCEYIRKYVLKIPRDGTRIQLGVFISCGARSTEKNFACSDAVMEIFFGTLDVRYDTRIFVDGVENKGDVAAKKAALGKIDAMCERIFGP